MKAQFVNENIKFERGKDPKDAMGIGHWDIKRALLSQKPTKVDTIEGDAARDWWESGGIPKEFKKEIGYNRKDPLSFTDFIGFDDDYYLESEAPDWVDYDEFHAGFTPTGPRNKIRNENGHGTFSWQRGELYDGSRVYHYQDAMHSGYLSKKEWLK